MRLKLVGALLVIISCGGFGFAIGFAHRRQDRLLRQLAELIQKIQWELEYRMTPLPELCKMASEEAEGLLKNVFSDLRRELMWKTSSDVSACMASVLHRNPNLPPKPKRLLRHLGQILGRYDLQGQLRGLASVLEEARNMLSQPEKERNQRIRSYQTLGLCAGAALVIILF